MTTHSFIKQRDEYLGNGCSSSIITHVVVQSYASELLGILHQLCQRGAGVDGAAHILECQLLQRWLQYRQPNEAKMFCVCGAEAVIELA